MQIFTVHHIDEDRTNNSLDNPAWLCQNCHYLVHHDEEERRAFTSMLERC